ncbi:formate dehydrogenase, subunit FdhD [Vibrio nigripulchritudo ATCC 27043]|uniref:formate dehydrogenase accessory sulfurtransferase FdhD n=1 Tax=Vibrio nigripulchritudo TaxID=28173 RepID=UPI00021C4207|nr:formate dehydrogenase accessory sulfurtransferase FdhD [Vibrio nigripulchritudo]EGU56747.1 formate dehydrogenase, subunit FdhD [Vibrio nigripulchritudo ATCC 27043]
MTKIRATGSVVQVREQSSESVRSVNRLKISRGHATPQTDTLVVEEPLAIWLRQKSEDTINEKLWMSTMRTPGQDEEMVTGLLLAEGVVTSAADIRSINLNEDSDGRNQCAVEISDKVVVDFDDLTRAPSYSSCGICGKSSIRWLETRGVPALQGESGWLHPQVVTKLLEILKSHQALFAQTGASHGCALFDEQGEFLAIAEDVGRHNALDKLVGLRARDRKLEAQGQMVALSGRISIEMMQKIVVAGIPVVVSVGAPTHIAVQMAQRFGVTLIGFCQQASFNVYCGEHRLSESM